MCGILGTLGFDPGEKGLGPALDRIGHRGPDGRGQEALARASGRFGHTRLSIIDLSPAGAQPMANEDGSVQLVLNGEIYNHEELRRGLEARGHRFRGRCDAEVVVHLFEERGIALVDELVGMFAFALWDAKEGRLHLVRDRLGIKPLYWYEDAGGPNGSARLAFASELGALTALPGIEREPDPTAWWDFLTWGFVPSPKTIWKRARKLGAGERLEHDARGTRLARWWKPVFAPEHGRSEESWLEELDALLATVVREHLVSDVPVGLFLSGGVDSSLVATHANAAGDPLRAFTISFPERKDDELEDTTTIARLLGSPLVVGRFSHDELALGVPELPALFEEPFADHSALPMIGLSRTAAAELKVVLSGDGGDETHLGYSRYLKPGSRRALYALADLLPGVSALAGTSALRGVQWLRAAAEGELGRRCHFRAGIPARTKRHFAEIHAPELDGYDDYWLLREHDDPSLSPLARQQALDFAAHLPDGILTKVDRTSMRFGLEVRPPLLDHRLVDFAGRVPDALKIEAGVQKALLRKSLERHLPKEIVYARKRAFSVPIKRFMREGKLLPERDLDVFGAFTIRVDEARRVLSISKDSQRLWILYVLGLFLEHHGAGGGGGASGSASGVECAGALAAG